MEEIAGEVAGDATTDLFLALTPERVLAAVEAAGLRCNPVCYPLNSFENRVYEVELEDHTRIVAKFYRPGRWSEEQILEEHQFLHELDQDEVPVCPVRPFPDGGTLRRIDAIYYSLSDRSGGRAPDELDATAAWRLGMLVGRMHNVAARRPAEHRLRLTADRFIREDVAWLDTHATLPRHLRNRYLDAALAIADQLDGALAAMNATDSLAGTAATAETPETPQRSEGPEPADADAAEPGRQIHRLHGDLHLGNVLMRDGLLRVLDFDDMVVGPAVQDLWLALPGRDAWTLGLRERFLEGYEQFRLFDRSTLRLIEPLRGLRVIHYAAWLARRWHDPAFPAAWPHFGTLDYWQRETDDLEEQLALIRGELAPPADSAPGDGEERPAEEATLTNRDFFWDWEG